MWITFDSSPALVIQFFLVYELGFIFLLSVLPKITVLEGKIKPYLNKNFSHVYILCREKTKVKKNSNNVWKDKVWIVE